jgi:DNA-binding NarL/FixJ family response regulator
MSSIYPPVMLPPPNSSPGIGATPDVSRDCEFEWLLCLASKWQACSLLPAGESRKSRKPSRSRNGPVAVRPTARPGKSVSDVLIVSSRPEHLKQLIRVLDAAAATRVLAAFSWRHAEQTLSRRSVAVILCDDSLPDGSYRNLLFRRAGPDKPNVVVLLRWGEWHEHFEALQHGAFDVLRYPFQPDEVERVVLLALENYAARHAAPRDGKSSSRKAPASLPAPHARIASGLARKALYDVFEDATRVIRQSLIAALPPLVPKTSAAGRRAKKPSRRSA